MSLSQRSMWIMQVWCNQYHHPFIVKFVIDIILTLCHGITINSTGPRHFKVLLYYIALCLDLIKQLS